MDLAFNRLILINYYIKVRFLGIKQQESYVHNDAYRNNANLFPYLKGWQASLMDVKITETLPGLVVYTN